MATVTCTAIASGGTLVANNEVFVSFQQTGNLGAQGVQGVTGFQGFQGVTGAAGTNGSAGGAGAQGVQGVTGAAGTNGSAGGAGAQGVQGVTGAAGTNGSAGGAGATGATGPTEYDTFNASFALSGGGNVTWSNGTVTWSQRVIAIPVNKTFGTSGYLDIGPTSVGVADWTGIYYAPPRGSANSYNSSYLITKLYTDTQAIAIGWIFICSKNAETGALKWNPGNISIPSGGTYYSTSAICTWNRPLYSNFASGTTLTPATNSYGTYYNITTSACSAFTIPSATWQTDSNAYWVFRNNCGAYLGITVTWQGTYTSAPSNPITIPPNNSVTIMLVCPSGAGGASNYVLF